VREQDGSQSEDANLSDLSDEVVDESTPPPSTISAGRLDALSRELSRDLPCLRCGYDLVGLSVRDRCPECGTPVRATLLAVVDPLAAELAPIYSPRILFAAMCVWSISTLFCSLAVWIMRGLEFATAGGPQPALIGWLGPAAAGLLALAGVSLVPVARPHGRLEPGTASGVMVAIVAYLCIAALLWFTFTGVDAQTPTIFASATADDGRRTMLRLASGAATAVIVLGLSRVWKSLQSRSVLMRSGRLDRQSTPSLLAAIAIAAAGDIIWLLFKPEQDTSIEGSLVRIISIALIGVGSMLLTVGIVAIVIDVIKLRPVILAAPLTFDDMTRPDSRRGTPPSASRGSPLGSDS